MAARRLFYFSRGPLLPVNGPCSNRGSCCSGEVWLPAAASRCRCVHPRPIFRAAVTRTATTQAKSRNRQLLLRGDSLRNDFGRKVAALLLWKPTIRKFEAQNAITFTVRESQPTPKLHSAAFQSLLAINNNAGIGPIPWLPFVPHRPWLQHLSVLDSGSPCWRLAMVADIGSSRITQSQRALGQARQAQRKVGLALEVSTIDDHTGL